MIVIVPGSLQNPSVSQAGWLIDEYEWSEWRAEIDVRTRQSKLILHMEDLWSGSSGNPVRRKSMHIEQRWIYEAG